MAIGLPLEREGFQRSLRHHKSYAAAYLEDPSGEEWAWQKAHERFVKPCQEALSTIESLGGKVISPVNPEALSSAAQHFPVVALFTHSIWEPFEVAHATDAEGLVERLMFGRSFTCEVFRNWLAAYEEELRIDAGGISSRIILEALATASQRAHRWWEAYPGTREPRDPASVETAIIENFCRPEIDRQFAECVCADEGIELGGGMHGLVEVFGRLNSDGEACIFDLRMCNSGMLMNSVKALHPESLVVVNQWQTNPIYGLFRYKAILQDLKNRHCSYLSACERIHTSRTL